MTFDANRLPIWLRRTPEQQAADIALQERLRQAAGPGIHPTPTERHLLRAAAVARSAEAHLQHLRLKPTDRPDHVKNAEAQLAEAWASQGKYTEAAELHPDPEHAERFQAIAAAIDRDDDDATCDCPVERTLDPATNRTLTVTSDHIAEMVYSPKHGKLTPLIKCAHCGDLNVKAAPAHLQERINRTQEAQRSVAKETRK